MPAPLYSLTGQQVPRSGVLVLENATVVDTESGAGRGESTVVVDGPRIAAVGSAGRGEAPADAEVVDLGGRYVIPGLWDMHVHVFADEQLPLFLYNGVTGIRHMGGAPAHGRWRDQLLAGQLRAPRMVVASPIIDGPQPLRPGSIAVTTEADAQAAVQQSIDGGADFLKVYNLVPRAAYFALAEEAGRQQIPFVGHVPFAVSVEEASDWGQASIEHLEGVVVAASADRDQLLDQLHQVDSTDLAAVQEVFAELLPRAAARCEPDRAAALFQRFVANGTWQVPTLTVLQAAAYSGSAEFPLQPYLRYMEPWLRQMWESAGDWMGSPEERARQRELFASQLDLVGQLYHAGVELLAGTDTFVSGFSLHDELALLVHAGLSPLEALRTATLHPARYLDATDDFGAVTAGKLADLAILDHDPREDIRNTRSLHALVLGGHYLDRAHLDGLLTEFETRTAETTG